jgi:hypothetical protein
MNSCLSRLFDVVEDAEPYRVIDFFNDSFAMTATAISKLPAEERELALAEIECGRLRAAVAKFERPVYPVKPNGKMQ